MFTEEFSGNYIEPGELSIVDEYYVITLYNSRGLLIKTPRPFAHSTGVIIQYFCDHIEIYSKSAAEIVAFIKICNLEVNFSKISDLGNKIDVFFGEIGESVRKSVNE